MYSLGEHDHEHGEENRNSQVLLATSKHGVQIEQELLIRLLYDAGCIFQLRHLFETYLALMYHVHLTSLTS